MGADITYSINTTISQETSEYPDIIYTQMVRAVEKFPEAKELSPFLRAEILRKEANRLEMGMKTLDTRETERVRY